VGGNGEIYQNIEATAKRFSGRFFVLRTEVVQEYGERAKTEKENEIRTKRRKP
jgi:hypothetical protein